MALYEELVNMDILRPILSGFDQGKFKMLRNGKILWMSRVYVEPNSPWMFAMVDPKRKCTKWLGVYHKYYKIIPRACRGCWKVAYRPKNLKEMKATFLLQQEMGIPSKCGIEMRVYSGAQGAYGSFWYAPLTGGLKQGKRLYEVVRKNLTTLLGRDIRPELILKRGCTEMEQYTVEVGIGGSDRWDEGAENYDLVEDLLDATFINPKIKEAVEPNIMRIHTERMWIEWAFQYGDQTYLEFAELGAFPLPAIDYRGKEYSGKDFR